MPKKKDTTEEIAPETQKPLQKAAQKNASVIIKARITEKAARGSERGMYAFDVAPTATKSEIKKAFKTLYNVVPVKVHTIVSRQRYAFKRNRLQTVRASKKAYVFIPKGTSITL